MMMIPKKRRPRRSFCRVTSPIDRGPGLDTRGIGKVNKLPAIAFGIDIEKRRGSAFACWRRPTIKDSVNHDAEIEEKDSSRLSLTCGFRRLLTLFTCMQGLTMQPASCDSMPHAACLPHWARFLSRTHSILSIQDILFCSTLYCQDTCHGGFFSARPTETSSR